eukprot:791503-Pyramimonas_sp.AAC.1
MMLLEVDDFFIGSSDAAARSWIRGALENRLRFGKYREGHAGPVDFAGRKVTFAPGKVTIDQE